jgi:hypothetical protein
MHPRDPTNSRDWDKEQLQRSFSDPCLDDARSCPFCFTKRLALISGPRGLTGRTAWRVQCTNCLSCGPWHLSPMAAVQFWNGNHRGGTDEDISDCIWPE